MKIIKIQDFLLVVILWLTIGDLSKIRLVPALVVW